MSTESTSTEPTNAEPTNAVRRNTDQFGAEWTSQWTEARAKHVPLRVYRPTEQSAERGAEPGAEPAGSQPGGAVLLWVHGGAFAGGDLDMAESDWVASALAEHGHTVVTVCYRLADDQVKYPAPSDDVLDAWGWVVAHADELSGRESGTASVHLGGASAGGNLSVGAALRLRDGDVPSDSLAANAPLPASLVLAYPTLHGVQRPPSAELAALLQSLPVEARWSAAPVREMYEYFTGLPVEQSPQYAVPGIVDPTGMPPMIIVASETDGLRSSAEEYVEALRRAGIRHEYTVEPDTVHGHINRPGLPPAHDTIPRYSTWLDGQW